MSLKIQTVDDFVRNNCAAGWSKRSRGLTLTPNDSSAGPIHASLPSQETHEYHLQSFSMLVWNKIGLWGSILMQSYTQ
jgi:hypothetical protein